MAARESLLDATSRKWLTYRLTRWADARERGNPFGHGKTGTALLRDAAAEIDRLHAALRAVEQYPAGDNGFRDIAREALRGA